MGVSQTAASVLGPGVSEFVHEPLKTFRILLLPFGPCVWMCALLVFKTRCFEGLSQMQVLKVGVPHVVYTPFTLQGEAPGL